MPQPQTTRTSGVVILDVDPGDKRNRLAKLTKKGASKLRETAALWQVAQERFEKEFGVEKAASLRKALAVIASEQFDEAFEALTTSPINKAHPSSRST